MFIGIHLGLTYAFGFLLGKYLNVSNKDAGKLAILASIFGILPDLDFFIQLITDLNVHRYVAHSVIIGLGICLLLVFWKRVTAIIAFGTLLILIVLGISLENRSLYFTSFSFALLLIFAITSYAFIKPGLDKKVIFLSTFIPYVSHVLFDLPAGGSAVLFPIPYILTGQIYWMKLDVFPETGPLPVSFWLLELMGAVLAISVMIVYQNVSYKNYSCTALAGVIALLIPFMINYNYLGMDEVIVGLIIVYMVGAVLMDGRISFLIMNSWAGYCMVNILFNLSSL